MHASAINTECVQTAQLIEKIREGSRTAVDQLFTLYLRPLKQLIHGRLDKKLRRRVDASDVMQEVLLEASRRLPDYVDNPTMPFAKWIRQIARDRMIDAYRRHRGSAKRSMDREQALVSRSPRDDQSSKSGIDCLLPANSPDPAEVVIRNELAKKVEQSISKLNDLDKRMIEMRHFEMRTNAEIADLLNLSAPAASMRYLRAIRRLKVAIKDDADGVLSG